MQQPDSRTDVHARPRRAPFLPVIAVLMRMAAPTARPPARPPFLLILGVPFKRRLTERRC